MKYEFRIDEKVAEVSCSDNFTAEELAVVKEMFTRLIDSQLIRLKEQERDLLMLNADINSLPELSARAKNILTRNGCRTVRDVLDCTLPEIRKMRNMGISTLEEVKDYFSAYGDFRGSAPSDEHSDTKKLKGGNE